MIEVKLEWYEVTLAASVGVRRQIEAVRAGRSDQYGASSKQDGWQIQIEGAAGEMAVARVLGRYWNGSVNTFKKGGDVGAYQVRLRRKHDWDLIVRSGDRDDDYFILVTGVAPTFRVVGWIKGADAKQDQWLQNHGGHGAAYFVPQRALSRFRP